MPEIWFVPCINKYTRLYPSEMKTCLLIQLWRYLECMFSNKCYDFMHDSDLQAVTVCARHGCANTLIDKYRLCELHFIIWPGGTDFFIVWQFWHINIIEFDLQYSNSSYIFLWVVEKIAFLAWWPIWPQNRNWHNANAKDVYNNVNITVDQWSWRQWNSWFISYSAIVEVIFISSEALRQLP